VEITVNFVLAGYKSSGPLASLSANLAYRLVSDQAADAVLSDKDKRLQVHAMSLSFPLISVTDAK